MELVLGLAALATAISGATGAGHYSDAPVIKEAEQTTAYATETPHQQEIQEVDGRIDESYLDHLNESEYGKVDFAKTDGVDPKMKAHPLSNPEKEDNNTFKKANDMGSLMGWYNNWSFTNHPSDDAPSIGYTTMNGTIDSASDQDWFTFTLYGKASLNIQLTHIPPNCNYDITLYKKSNVPNAKENDLEEIASSNRNSTYDENISEYVYPGVYYVKVYSVKGNGTSIYYLYCGATYDREEDLKVKDVMDWGAKAALWMADYDPFGIKATQSIDSNIVGTKVTSLFPWKKKNEYNPEFPFEENVSYKHAELFVWDLTIRNELYDAVTNLIEQANTKYTNAVNLHMTLQRVEAAADILLTIAGEAGGDEVSLILSGLTIAKDLATLIFPEGDTFAHYQDVKSYFRALKAALECDDDDDVEITPSREVVKIPMRYTITKTDIDYDYLDFMPLTTKSTYRLSYEPMKPDEDHYLYKDGKKPFKDRKFHSIDWEGESPFAGTIYPITDAESVQMAKNRKKFDMSCQTLEVNDENTFSLNRNQYKWFKFEAPRNGVFHITSEGDSEATMEIFDRMVYGKSVYQRKDIKYQNNPFRSGFTYSKYFTQGETIFFRVSGGYQEFDLLNSTTVKISDKSNEKVISFYADQLNLGSNWNDNIPVPDQWLNEKGLRVVDKENARINIGNDCLELEADTHEDWSQSYIVIQFDRPIKMISFDAAYGTWWRYSRNPLIISGLTNRGQNVVTYWEDSMNYDFYEHRQRYSYVLHDPNQGFNDYVYSILLMLDPYQTQDSYHNYCETVHIDGFAVEYAD